MIRLAYIRYFRLKRKRAEKKFDRSISGELDHAISNTNSIIKFYQFMILGYITPLYGLNFSKMIIRGAPLNKWLLMTGTLLLVLILMRLTQNKFRNFRKEQLLALKKMLTEE